MFQKTCDDHHDIELTQLIYDNREKSDIYIVDYNI